MNTRIPIVGVTIALLVGILCGRSCLPPIRTLTLTLILVLIFITLLSCFFLLHHSQPHRSQLHSSQLPQLDASTLPFTNCSGWLFLRYHCCRWRDNLTALCFYLPFVFIGLLAYSLHTFPSQPLSPTTNVSLTNPSPDAPLSSTVPFSPDAASPISFRGVVMEVTRTQHSVRCFLLVTATKPANKWLSANRLIAVCLPDSSQQSVEAGDALLFHGRIHPLVCRPETPSYDYMRWLQRMGTDGIVYVNRVLLLPDETVAQDMAAIGWTKRLQWRAVRIRSMLSRCYDRLDLPNEDLAVLKAMTLGDKSRLTPAMKLRFNHTGCSHVLALSGLHLGILMGIVFLAIHRLKRSRTAMAAGCLAALMLIWGFAWVTGMSVSLQRAAWMCTLWVLGIMRQRRTEGLTTLCLAACLLLLADPDCVEDVGFQLSFVSVGFILLTVPPIDRWLRSLPSLLHGVADIGAVGLVAQTGTLPLVVYHFGNIPTYALLSGFIAIPCAYVLLCSGWLYLTTCVAGCPLVLLGKATGYTAHLLNSSLDMLSQLPMAVIKVPSVAWWQVVIVYLCMGCSGGYLKQHSVRWLQLLLVVLAGGVMLHWL